MKKINIKNIVAVAAMNLIVCGFAVIAAIQSFFTGQLLKTIYQKNRQDFEMDLFRVTSEMQDKENK